MITGMLRKGIHYVKGIQDVSFFATMGNSKWLAAFTGTPLFYVMLPFIGILMTALSIINAYELAVSNNKNIDSWLNFTFSLIAAVCSSISLYGTAISTAMGLSFAAGPWFFLSGILSGIVHQSVMLALNLHRAYEAKDEVKSRSHYLQSALNNAFNLGLLTLISLAISFVLLTPVAPIVGSICAFAAVSLISMNILWSLTPRVGKNFIKEKLGIIPVECLSLNTTTISLGVDKTAIAQTELEPQKIEQHKRLFSYPDLIEKIKRMDQSSAEKYIKGLISVKINLLNGRAEGSEKNTQKLSLLRDLLAAMNQHQLIKKDEVIEKYPYAFQRFWAEHGEVEQLYLASMKCIRSGFMEHSINQLSMQ